MSAVNLKNPNLISIFRGDGNDVVPNFDWILAKEKEPETPVSQVLFKIPKLS